MIACAEQIGWLFMNMSVKDDECVRCAVSPNGKFHYRNGSYDKVQNEFYPDYEHDRNALYELMLNVPEDKHEKFIKAIFGIRGINAQMFPSALEGYSWDGNIPEALWGLLTADPITIMRAFLTVMEITSKYH